MFFAAVIAVLLIIALLVVAGVWVLYRVVQHFRSPPVHHHAVVDTTATRDSTMTSNSQENVQPSPWVADFSFRHTLRNSVGLRSVIIGILTLLMLVPLSMVGEIIGERGYRYQSVLDGIAATWGQPQTIVAPILIVPFTETYKTTTKIPNGKGEIRSVEKTIVRQNKARVLPTDLQLDIKLTDEFRRRGIFKSLVYNADVTIDASFTDIDIASLSDRKVSVLWHKASLAVGLSDTKAINRVESVLWNTKPRKLAPGTGLESLATGFHAELGLPESPGSIPESSPGSIPGSSSKPPATPSSAPSSKPELPSHTVRISMNVNGSGMFQFAPLGETTEVTMQSSWPHPSFIGSALPQSHTINDTGFTSTWSVPHLARNYSQVWTEDNSGVDLFEFTSGVSMFEPVSLYSRVTRAVKYGVLFVALTFLTLFVFEISVNKKLHLIQYALIGVSLSLFYLVLLSLSEHVSFLYAYLAASFLCILMISCYASYALSSPARASLLFVLLSGLYALLYSLLQIQDYALLMGTGLLVVVVIVLMFVTRNLQEKPAVEESASQPA